MEAITARYFTRILNWFVPCYGLNACVLPAPTKFICWNPNHQGDGVRRWDRWEVIKSWGQNPTNEISALVKEASESLPAPFRHVKVQWEVCNLGEGLIQPCWHPLLRFWASGTMINFCCLSATQTTVFCYSSQNGLIQSLYLPSTNSPIPNKGNR